MKVYVGYYLSTNTSWEKNNDTFLGDDYSSLYSSDTYDGENASLTIPSNTSSGTYYILFVADYKKEYDETNDGNNVEYEKIVVTITGAKTCTPKNQKYWTGRVDSYRKIDEGIIVGKAFANVSRSWMKFDLSGIPDGAVIKQVDIKFYVDVVATKTSSFELMFSVLSSDPVSASRSTLRSEIISNSKIECRTCGESIGYRTLTNMTTLNSEVKNSLSKNWIAIGLYEKNEDSDNCHIHGYSGNKPKLTITYEY